MRQVVGPIRPVWVKGSFNFKNGANWRKQTHISDIRQNTISMVLVRGQVLANICQYI